MLDGTTFVVVGCIYLSWTIKSEEFYTADDGCFQPFLEIDEGFMVEPFGTEGWDAHYGTRMEFRRGEPE